MGLRKLILAGERWMQMPYWKWQSLASTEIGLDLQMGHGRKTLLYCLANVTHFRHSFLVYCTVSTLRNCKASISPRISASLQLIHYLLFINQHIYDVNYRFPTPQYRWWGHLLCLGSIQVNIPFPVREICQLCDSLHIADYVQFIQGYMIWKTLHDSGQFHERKLLWGVGEEIVK